MSATKLTLTAVNASGRSHVAVVTHASPYGAWAACAHEFDRVLGVNRWSVVAHPYTWSVERA